MTQTSSPPMAQIPEERPKSGSEVDVKAGEGKEVWQKPPSTLQEADAFADPRSITCSLRTREDKEVREIHF